MVLPIQTLTLPYFDNSNNSFKEKKHNKILYSLDPKGKKQISAYLLLSSRLLQNCKMMSTNNSLKCSQWNSNGLLKSNLEEFKHFLHLQNPDLAIVSETHWSSKINPSFHNYKLFRINRNSGQKDGGVFSPPPPISSKQLA